MIRLNGANVALISLSFFHYTVLAECRKLNNTKYRLASNAVMSMRNFLKIDQMEQKLKWTHTDAHTHTHTHTHKETVRIILRQENRPQLKS
jgi:hypothetical protein